jgi:hypothetical protein
MVPVEIARRLYLWLDDVTRRRVRLLILAGVVLSVWMALSGTAGSVYVSTKYVADELSRPEDIHNLYYAAQNATWSDAPKWFVGPWNYPGIRYYRPLTSLFFLVEQRAYDKDFTAYNRITWLFHGLNAGLLFLFVVSLFSHHPRARILLGLLSARYFATPASSVFFGVHFVIHWWPAQNDATCLAAGLAFLIMLDRYLKTGRRPWLWGALWAFAVSICFKEMGYVAAPMALGLVWYRKRRLDRSMAAVITVALAFWALRWAVVPKPYGQSYLQWWIFRKLLQYWGGAPYLFMVAGIWWHTVAGVLITLIVCFGVRRKLPAAYVAGAIVVVALLCAEYVPEVGSWATLFEPTDMGRLISVLTFPLAMTVFWRYRQSEPGLWACASWLITYLPSIHLINLHYYYWPGAFLAVTDAAFCACLWRWAVDMKKEANWSLNWRPAQRPRERAEADERAEAEANTVGAAP